MSKCIERIFQKYSLKPNAASHNNASWYNDIDMFLEHSPCGGTLYCKGPALRKQFCFLDPLLYFMYSTANAASGYLLTKFTEYLYYCRKVFWQHQSRCSNSTPMYLPWRNPHTYVRWVKCENICIRCICKGKTLEIAKISIKRRIYIYIYVYVYSYIYA